MPALASAHIAATRLDQRHGEAQSNQSYSLELEILGDSCLSSLASGFLSHPNYSLSTAVELQAHNATHNPFIVAPHQSVPVTVGVHRFLLTFVGRVTWATSSPEVAGTLRACLTAHVVYCVEDSILTAVKLLHTKTWQASEEHSSECLQEFHLAGLQGVGTTSWRLVKLGCKPSLWLFKAWPADLHVDIVLGTPNSFGTAMRHGGLQQLYAWEIPWRSCGMRAGSSATASAVD